MQLPADALSLCISRSRILVRDNLRYVRYPYQVVVYISFETRGRFHYHIWFYVIICSLAQIVKIAISLSVLFTFGLAYYVPISVLWPMIRSRIAAKGSRQRRIYEITLRLGGVVACSKYVAVRHER